MPSSSPNQLTFEDIEWMPPEQRRFFEREGYRVYDVRPEDGLAAFEKAAGENCDVNITYDDFSRDQRLSTETVELEASVWKGGDFQERTRRLSDPSLGAAERAARDAESRAREILKEAGEPEASGPNSSSGEKEGKDPSGGKEPRGPDPGEGAGLGL